MLFRRIPSLMAARLTRYFFGCVPWMLVGSFRFPRLHRIYTVSDSLVSLQGEAPYYAVNRLKSLSYNALSSRKSIEFGATKQRQRFGSCLRHPTPCILRFGFWYSQVFRGL